MHLIGLTRFLGPRQRAARQPAQIMHETKRATTEPQRTSGKAKEAQHTACQIQPIQNRCATACPTCLFFTLCASSVNNPGHCARSAPRFCKFRVSHRFVARATIRDSVRACNEPRVLGTNSSPHSASRQRTTPHPWRTLSCRAPSVHRGDSPWSTVANCATAIVAAEIELTFAQGVC
jgi:hypothetical protein